MTVGELIADLEQYEEDTEVRLMLQPSYPFEHSIKGLIGKSEIESEYFGDEEESEEEVVYVLEGTQIGYGNKGAFYR